MAQLGAVARQAGTPVSLHGTGGAWIVADATAPPESLASAVYHSLDSKKCNTLNTLCIVEGRPKRLVPVALDALRRREVALGHGYKLHVTPGAVPYVPQALFSHRGRAPRRGKSMSRSPRASGKKLGQEWEWGGHAEITLAVVQDVEQAIALFNRHSPHFVASLISQGEAPTSDSFGR